MHDYKEFKTAKTLANKILDYIINQEISNPLIILTSLSFVMAGMIKFFPINDNEQDELLKVTLRTITKMVKEEDKNA